MERIRHISIRIDADTLQKFHYVAKYDHYSASGKIMSLIHKTIRDFEKVHGKIELEQGDPDLPPRRSF